MSKIKILIVEDEADIGESIKLTLEERGYSVINIVATGEEAIDIIKSTEVNLVLMDIVLNSEMPGTVAAKHIKTYIDIPIIFLSAYFNEYTLEQAKASQPFGYILKPFNERELYATIEMAVYHDRIEKEKARVHHLLEVSNKIYSHLNKNMNRTDLLSIICKNFTAPPDYCASFILLLDDMNNISESAEEGLEENFSALSQQLADRDYPAWFRKTINHSGIVHEKGSMIGLDDNKKALFIRLESDQKVFGLLSVIIKDRELEEEESNLLLGISREIAYALQQFEFETKNKKTEIALVESNEKYKQVIENAVDIIFTCDLNGKIIFINESGLKNIGYSFEEIKDIDCFELVLPEHRKNVIDFYKKHLTGKTNPGYIEYPIVAKNNEIKWYGQNTNFLTEDQQIKGFQCIARDITERKKIEIALHDSEIRYRQLVEMSPDAIIVHNKGKIIFTNDAGVKLFRASDRNELLNKPIKNLFHPQSIDVSKARLKNFTGDDTNVPLHEQKIERLDGSLISVELTANNVLFQNENAVQVIIRDISERKMVEEELRRHQREVTTLLDSLPAYAFFKDSNAKYITANQKFCDAVGYSKEEIIGKTDFDLFPAVLAAKLNKDDMHVLSTGKMNYVYEEELYDRGKLIVVGTRKVPLKDDSGKILGLIGLAFDISERRAAEEAIKKYTKELEELNENKDKFFSIISHDLRSPFQGLLGLSNILVEEFDNLSIDEIKLFTSNIHNSTKSLFNLLENLLQWSRIQTGKIDIKPDKIDLQEEVLYNINLLNGNASKKDIKLISEINTTQFVYTDLNVLNSTLQNLITNAIKFTNTGGVIKISAVEAGANIELTVTDTGIGIAPEDIEKLFRIDTQHTTVGTNKESGTGLGLTICKELLEKQGGKIWVNSQVGKGSSFTFTLQKFTD